MKHVEVCDYQSPAKKYLMHPDRLIEESNVYNGDRALEIGKGG